MPEVVVYLVEGRAKLGKHAEIGRRDNPHDLILVTQERHEVDEDDAPTCLSKGPGGFLAQIGLDRQQQGVNQQLGGQALPKNGIPNGEFTVKAADHKVGVRAKREPANIEAMLQKLTPEERQALLAKYLEG